MAQNIPEQHQTIQITTPSEEAFCKKIAEKCIEGLRGLIEKLSSEKQDVELITVEEVQKLLGVSRPTVIRYQERKILKGYVIGSIIRFKKSEVLEALSKIK
jgi:excisionase family DNA binding protein